MNRGRAIFVRGRVFSTTYGIDSDPLNSYVVCTSSTFSASSLLTESN